MSEKYELIICEKPAQAQKIAEALADTKPTKKVLTKVSYYELTHKGKKIVVGCAVGHLYTLAEKNKKAWHYPVFDYEWKPTYEVNKEAKFSKAYLDVLIKLAKNADEYTIACDFDNEGSTIGWNILQFVCHQKDAKRMKFSTLTKDELIESYEHASPHLDFHQIDSGVTRHGLDWLWGLNLTRALTLSVKTATGKYKLLSIGRVQGPSLKFLRDREVEIQAFKPEPYWEIPLIGIIHDKDLLFAHDPEQYTKKADADAVLAHVKGKSGVVDNLEKRQTHSKPPYPFDLTSLQIEAYGLLGLSPHRTLEIAQDLYSNGWISYPRTSSQQLPESLNFKKILSGLSKAFPKETSYLLGLKKLAPNNGKKQDPAHPAIHPTGDVPKRIEDKAKGLYELIVRRFFATFGEDAVRESMSITIHVNKEPFVTRGTRTIHEGWFSLYRPFVRLDEEELPDVDKGLTVTVKDVHLNAKETQPPKRYTEASIIKELEKRNLGTKCLTADTLVTVKSDTPKSVKISDLFEESFKIPEHYSSLEISLNYLHECISLKKGRLMESHYPFISKRPLEPGETVYQIGFTDGSVLKATSEHPVLCYDKDKLIYKPLSQIKPNDLAVAVHSWIDKTGDVIQTWEEFLTKCDPSTKLYAPLDLRSIRQENQGDLAAIFSVSQSAISDWEKNKRVPLYVLNTFHSKPDFLISIQGEFIKNPFPLRISSPLTRLLGCLIGDGSLDREKLRKENCYDFRYTNKNFRLIQRFIQDIAVVFNVSVNYHFDEKQRYTVQIPAAIGRIIGLLAHELLTKDVSALIPPAFYPELIGALFDDEGHSTKNEPKIFISNTNFNMLENLQNALTSLGITSSLSKKQYKLYIRGIDNLCFFLQKIPILSLRKKERLISYLTRFYSYKGKSAFLLQKKILFLLSQRPQTSMQLVEQCNIKRAKTLFHLTKLLKKGFINKKVIGISKRPRKETLYLLNCDPCKTFYSLIDEHLLNEELVTKKIVSIEPIPYAGEVYDITNNLSCPNFMLDNRVLVHNSTRATILQNLYDRNYVHEKSIHVTDLGMKTIATLEKYCPDILNEELTREFEDDMEQIYANKLKGDKIIANAKTFLEKTLTTFKKHEKEIGGNLEEAAMATLQQENHLGQCPNCKEGSLQMRRGKFGLFAACSKYPDCKTTFSLPKSGKVKPTDKLCTQCQYPMVQIFRAKRKPQQLCINPECPTKKADDERLQALVKGKKCPNCGKELVVRKSFYGAFFACPGYPKCRHIEKLPAEEKELPAQEETTISPKKTTSA